MHLTDVKCWADSVSEAQDGPEVIVHGRKRPRSEGPAAYLPSPTLQSHDSESNVTRSSSPRRQIVNAKLQPTGFNTVAIASYVSKPPSLQLLLQQLDRLTSGLGILPASLRTERGDDLNFQPEFFGNSDNIFPGPHADGDRACAFAYPPLQRVRVIQRRAEDCKAFGLSEASWNLEVHGPIFEWLLRDAPGSDGPLDYRYCKTASILPAYQPINAPSHMVDFCLAIHVDRDNQKIIENLRTIRPGLSIGHTDWGDFDHRPIPISIETKAGLNYDRALLQLSTWHAAQWRSLMHGGTLISRIEFLAGIIVCDHDWYFVANVLDDDGKSTMLHEVPLGSTRTVMGIYKLFASLHRLRLWGETEFWPAFCSDILGSSKDTE